MRTLLLTTIIGLSAISYAQTPSNNQVTPIKKIQSTERGKVFGAELKNKDRQKLKSKTLIKDEKPIEKAKVEGVKQD